jgi:hypothetical protein
MCQEFGVHAGATTDDEGRSGSSGLSQSESSVELLPQEKPVEAGGSMRTRTLELGCDTTVEVGCLHTLRGHDQVVFDLVVIRLRLVDDQPRDASNDPEVVLVGPANKL